MNFLKPVGIKSNFPYLIIIFALALVVTGLYFAPSHSIGVEMSTASVGEKSKLNCSPAVETIYSPILPQPSGTPLFQQRDNSDNTTADVKVETIRNTDKAVKFTMEIGKDTLTLTTQGILDNGESPAYKLAVTENTKDAVLANGYTKDTPYSTVYTLTLIKKSGFAAWTKSRPSLLSDKTIDANTTYLTCL